MEKRELIHVNRGERDLPLRHVGAQHLVHLASGQEVKDVVVVAPRGDERDVRVFRDCDEVVRVDVFHLHVVQVGEQLHQLHSLRISAYRRQVEGRVGEKRVFRLAEHREVLELRTYLCVRNDGEVVQRRSQDAADDLQLTHIAGAVQVQRDQAVVNGRKSDFLAEKVDA